MASAFEMDVEGVSVGDVRLYRSGVAQRIVCRPPRGGAMAHLAGLRPDVDPEVSYRLLQQWLDRNVTGAPDSPTFQKILRLLFTPRRGPRRGLGRAPRGRASLRVLIGGALALAIALGIGRVTGAVI